MKQEDFLDANKKFKADFVGNITDNPDSRALLDEYKDVVRWDYSAVDINGRPVKDCIATYILSDSEYGKPLHDRYLEYCAKVVDMTRKELVKKGLLTPNQTT